MDLETPSEEDSPLAVHLSAEVLVEVRRLDGGEEPLELADELLIASVDDVVGCEVTTTQGSRQATTWRLLRWS